MYGNVGSTINVTVVNTHNHPCIARHRSIVYIHTLRSWAITVYLKPLPAAVPGQRSEGEEHYDYSALLH